ncbi:MAG: hypothetical protein EBR82_10505 [Caulobacteraceae bacterium]|nr:hypothetical protein [Caulobacteraceae bacterium]
MHDLFGEPIAEPKQQVQPKPRVLVINGPDLPPPRPFKLFRISPTEIIVWHDLDAQPPEVISKPETRPLDALGF